MTNDERARQFLPFDSLKGLQEALRIKEYEHERMVKGDISEDVMKKISDNILATDGKKRVKIKYYEDGYYKNIEGFAKINYNERTIKINDIKISFEMIFDYEFPEDN